jgi:hypothetical protein
MNSYELYRPEIKTGDLIEWSPDTIIGRAIRYCSGRDVSHTSIVVRSSFSGLRDRVIVIEALAKGLRPTLLSDSLDGYNGKVYWVPLLDAFGDGIREAIGSYALLEFVRAKERERLFASGYDYGALFRNLLGYVSMDGKKYFCSEYAHACWHFGGCIVQKIDGEKAARPGDFEQFGVTGERRLIYDSGT